MALADSLLRSRSVAVVAVAATVFAGTWLVRELGLLQGFELRVYDQYLRYAKPENGSSYGVPVVLLEISETDIREQGHWPISDRTLAVAVESLLEAGAAVVGIDIYRDLPVSPGQERFARLLRDEPRILGVNKFGDLGTEGIPGPPALAGTGRVGFNDIVFDRDETVRRALLYQDDGEGEVQSSFGLLAALSLLAREGVHPAPDPARPEWLRLGAATLRPFEGDDGGYANEDDGGYQLLLDFAQVRRGFDTFQLTPFLRGEIDPERIRGKAVVIGANAKSLPDRFRVPIRGRIPGMEAHAHIIDQLHRLARGESTPIRVIPEWQELALIALLTLVGCSLGLVLRGGPLAGLSSFSGVVLAATALIWLAGAVAFHVGWWLPMVAPGLAWTVGLGATSQWLSGRERAERRQLMQIFSRHVSEEVAQEIWRNRTAFVKDGRPRAQRLTVTSLFVDMRDYTSQSEKMSPEDLMSWTNQFLECMAGQIALAGGIVDDYFGDGIKADFGVPVPRETPEDITRDARSAVGCALAMGDALQGLNQRYRNANLPEAAIRIGVHTGPVVAGSIGSANRLKYTVMGSVVITAQRLESTDAVPHDFTRNPCRILASETTWRRVAELVESEPVGELELKGMAQKTAAYRILGWRNRA
jgi:adenylate cyclase